MTQAVVEVGKGVDQIHTILKWQWVSMARTRSILRKTPCSAILKIPRIPFIPYPRLATDYRLNLVSLWSLLKRRFR